jgi:hypothetical protein
MGCNYDEDATRWYPTITNDDGLLAHAMTLFDHVYAHYSAAY